MREYNLYQVVETQDVYRYDAFAQELVQLGGKELGFIRYKEQLRINWQYLNSEQLTDVYLGFVGHTITGSVAIDNNWLHYYSGTISAGYSGTVTSIVATGFTGLSASEPTTTGEILLINGAGQSESVAYTVYSLDGSDYTFTVSATLSYVYLNGDTCRLKDTPIVKTSTIDTTDKDTGLIVCDLDAYNEVFQVKVQSLEQIQNCVLEMQIVEAGDLIFVAQTDWLAINLVDDASALPPPASGSSYYTKTEVDALLLDKMNFETANVDFKTAQQNTVYTVPAGYWAIPWMGIAFADSVTAYASAHTYKWLADAVDLTITDTSNIVSSGPVDKDSFGVSAYPAGTVFYYEVVAGATGTTVSGKVNLAFLLIQA